VIAFVLSVLGIAHGAGHSEMNRQAQWPSLRRFASVSTALKIVAVVVLLLVAGAAFYELQASRHAIIADTERQMSRLDMVFAEQTSRVMESIDRLVLGAAETVQSQAPPIEGLADTLRRRIRGGRQLSALVVYDTEGHVRVATDPDMVSIPADLVDSILSRYRQDPRMGLIISPPFRVAENKWNALLARPMCAPDGTLTGMAVGSINLSYFEDFYRAVELSENGAIILHLRDGTVLARYPHVDKAIGTSFGKLPPFTEVLAHAQAGTLLMESPVDGSIRVTAIRALRAFPLAVMVSVEQGRILVDWRHEAWALIIVALLPGGAVVILLLSLSHRSRQVERLLEESHIARDMAERAKDHLLEQIAERARAEGALRQAQRIEAIGQLTGGVAHDFNNLLMVVLGNVDILQRRAEAEGNPMMAERLLAIRAAAERGATLTRHLLAFARRQPLMPKPIDLNATILGMENLLNSALSARARARFRLPNGLWLAMVDQSQIELVILNLVLNARDAMPDGGVITIETANYRRSDTIAADGPPPGDYVSITVRDTGTGIAPDILPRVFEPFFTTKPTGVGSGLGLSQVFGTAKQLGGEVHITTEVGLGTAVTVDLPRAFAVPLRSAGEQPPVARLEGSDATILLVDDDDPVRAVTAAMLQDLGYQVRDVANASDALAILDSDRGIDLLLTDLVMSGMNGTQLAAAARAGRADLPIVFISGYVDQVSGALGPDDRLIRKPFGAADLHQSIEAELATRRRVLSKA
jgi:signal transduction histidine kinase